MKTTVPVEWVTPTRYAKSRGLSANTVCKQLSQGKISHVNGLINPAVADAERARNLSPIRVQEAARRKAAAAPSDFELGQLDAIERIIAGFGRLPALLQMFGIQPRGILAAGDIFSELLWQALGDDTVVRLFGEAGPPRTITASDKELCNALGLEHSPALTASADLLYEKAAAFLDKSKRSRA